MGNYFYAEILEGRPFVKKVPIYHPKRKGFIESLGYKQVRQKPTPSWQNSIRKVSSSAFHYILQLAGVESNYGEIIALLESESDAITILEKLNSHYSGLLPKERAKIIQKYIDRGSAVTKALKTLLGAKCQICEWPGFTKRSGEEFIEAHHIVQLSEKKEGSLCTENIILVCPNCHREIHYGDTMEVLDNGDNFEISLSAHKNKIFKNTMTYISTKSSRNRIKRT
jgi:predicted HNH restriction endonuclease